MVVSSFSSMQQAHSAKRKCHRVFGDRIGIGSLAGILSKGYIGVRRAETDLARTAERLKLNT